MKAYKGFSVGDRITGIDHWGKQHIGKIIKIYPEFDLVRIQPEEEHHGPANIEIKRILISSDGRSISPATHNGRNRKEDGHGRCR